MKSSSTRKIGKLSGLVVLCAGMVATLAPATGSASTLSNTTPIAIPQNTGEATPYPSSINVAGLPGTVSKAKVTLHGLTSDDIEDVDVILVAPDGRNSILISDACAVGQIANVTLTFDDVATAALSDGACSPATGTYKPFNDVGLDVFPAPGPGLAQFPASLGSFIGTAPNGAWNLFVRDDNVGGNPGSIQGGWTLSLDLKTRCSGRFVTDAGTAGDDVIQGTSDIDVIAGLAGNDTIRGLGDEDVLCGGPGKDKLFGGAGKDRLNGEGGKDKLVGGGGSPDICNGAGGKDKASSCEREKKI
jgi:Ca2+-binding RTX toxin-like protein